MKKNLSVKILFYILLLFTLIVFYKTFFDGNNYEKKQIITQIKFEDLMYKNNQSFNQNLNSINELRIFLKDQYLLLTEVADPYARNVLKFNNYNEFQTKVSVLSDGFIITTYIDIDFQEKKIMKYHEKIIEIYNKIYSHPIIKNRLKVKVDHYNFKKVFKFDYSLFLILSIIIDILFFSYFRRYLI